MAENNTSNSKKVHQGRTLKALRESYGWKQDVMADKLDVVQQTVSKYEGLEIVDNGVLQKYAEIFHVPVDLLKKFRTETPGEFNNYGENYGGQASSGNQVSGTTEQMVNCEIYNDYSDCPDKLNELNRKKGDILNDLSKVDQERFAEVKQVLDNILERLSNLESKK